MPESADAARRLQDALALGLTRAEYELVCAKQGRPPNQVELAMYSLLWSEHCAYKHSKKLLRTLPTEGEHVVMGPGENAGAVDVGGGLVCAFKVESHNHPSAVEPFQGAATGVGGILRDIFAIGARPIAVLDSLRFGEPGGATGARARYLLDGAGQRDRPLRQLDRRADRRRRGLLRGALRAQLPRQRDGARAWRRASSWCAAPPPARATCSCCSAPPPAATASAAPRCSPRPSSAPRARARRTSARPCRWATRSRRRSCWSARWSCCERGLLVSLQDLGAAGLTSSASEMASKGGVGIDIDVASGAAARARHGAVRDHGQRVPGADAVRGRARTAAGACWRCARSGRSAARRSARSPTRGACACSATASWSATCRCGRSSTTARCTTSRRAARRADLPAAAGHARAATPTPARGAARAAGAAPTSPRAGRCSSSTTRSCSRARCAAPSRPTPRCSRCPTASRARGQHRLQRPARRRRPLPRHGRGGARVRRQPRLRRRRAARHDQQPQLRQPREAAHRLAADASRCAASATPAARCAAPIVGGNVSLYNEGATGPIYPTPVIGMVGRLPDARRAGRLGFAARRASGSRWSGPFAPSLAASELAKLRGEPLPRRPARARRRRRVRAAAGASATRCARARSRAPTTSPRAGLAVALAECCLAGGLGARVELEALGGSDVLAERPVRRGPRRLPRQRPRRGPATSSASACRCCAIGTVGGDALTHRASRRAAEPLLELALEQLAATHAEGLVELFP